MISRFLPWVTGWINQHVKHRGNAGLGENVDFGWIMLSLDYSWDKWVEMSGRHVDT